MRSFGIFEVSKLAVNKKDKDNYLDIILGTHITGRSSIRISLFIDGKILADINYSQTIHCLFNALLQILTSVFINNM